MIRRLVPILVLAALAAALLPAGASAGPQPHVQLAHLREGTEVEALAVGPENYLWFAGANYGATPSNVVGRLSPSGAVDEYTVPGTAAVLGVGGLARGPEGDMWFTEPAAERIERVAPTGHPEGFTLPTAGSRPVGIAAAPGGFLWVTLEGTGKVVKVDPAGSAGEFALGAGDRPAALALGPDSALWAIETETATLTRISLQGSSTEYPLPTSGKIFKGAINSDIVTGPDGNLWLSQSDGPFIAQVVPTDTQPEYVRHEVPASHGTSLISNGPDHDLWYVAGNEIGSIATDGLNGEAACPLPACAGPITALSEGPEGALWFATGGGAIGSYQPPAHFTSFGRRVVGNPKTKKAAAAVQCRGGSAGEVCKGKLELRLRHGRGTVLARGHFAIPSMKIRAIGMAMTGSGAAMLAAKGRLAVRLSGTVGKVTTSGNYALRASR